MNIRQKRKKIEYTIDTDSNGNLLPISTFKILFPRATMEQLVKHKDIASFY